MADTFAFLHHELVWKTDRLYLELHKRLIPSYNKDFYAYFGEGWQLARIEQGTRYGMTAEDEMIFLFTHFAKHFRDGGIGCRYVADLWVYRNAHPTMDEEYIHTVLDKIQLSVFYDNILRLIDVWFCDTQSDAKTDFMTDFIFASGSWGTLESRAIANAVKFSRHHSSLGLRGKIKYVLHTLFPSVRQIEGKYTVLKKYPWLLPAVWLWRLGHKILFERKSFVRHQRMLAAFDPDDIQTRQQALNYVGLDYNF